MLYYFAYGSNMSPKRFKERNVDVKETFKGTLKGYKLVFNKQSKKYPGVSFANIEPDGFGTVEGVIYAMDNKNLERLDVFEGYPEHYRRDRLIVDIEEEKRLECLVYIAQPQWINNAAKPTQEYVHYLLEGKQYLSRPYYRRLRDYYNALTSPASNINTAKLLE